ncbi:uncharacterized protein LOC109948237 [Prunus persica]|uniref:uncharacterized protein LOC109948237 n=1 Tax=Prunus persica TaxID=3760 RepID=UPI0009AB5CE9|nr:uncharacterized protein LOC109948237 [Prunus persica]
MVVPAEGSDQHYNSLIISLEPLDRESCWDIFKDTAFGYQQHSEEVEIEIKDLFYGLPLAARTLAEIVSPDSQNLGRTSPPYRKYEELLKLPDLDVDSDCFGLKKFPMLVFIDMKYEKTGENCIRKFCKFLNKKQVVGENDVVN